MESEQVAEDLNINENELEAFVVREEQRVSRKPDIDHLEDAVADGRFIPTVGQKVIIERCASILSSRPWLDTKTYLVTGVDVATGSLRLFDQDMHREASSNFIKGADLGYRFKLPDTVKKGLHAVAVENNGAGAKPTKKETVGPVVRRIYNTRGVIHTRIKGMAYVPTGETKAKDADRLEMERRGSDLLIRHPVDKWEELWHPDPKV